MAKLAMTHEHHDVLQTKRRGPHDLKIHGVG